MAGYAVTVFETVQSERARRLAVFVELFEIIAVLIAVSPVGEYARVERNRLGTEAVEEVGLELNKPDTRVLVVKRVVRGADNAVYKVKTVFAVYVLLPVVLRAYQLVARFGKGAEPAFRA